MAEPNGSNDRYGAGHLLTLRDFLAVVFRRRRLVVISFLGIFCGAILVALLQPNHYDASMKILVKRERMDPVVTPDRSELPQFAPEVTEEEINSELELLKGTDLLQKVVLACKLLHRPGEPARQDGSDGTSANKKPHSADRDKELARAVRELQKNLKFEVVTKTNMIEVSYRSADPVLAAQVLKTLASVYLEKHLAVHRPPGALHFFQQQTQLYREGLANAEERLVNFTHNSAVVSARTQKDDALEKLAEFEATLKQTRAAIADTQHRIHVLTAESTTTPSRMVTQVRDTDDALLISHLRSDLLGHELQRTQLLDKFQPSYRPLLEVEAQIAQTRTALAAAEKTPLHEETTDGDPTYEWVNEELAKAKSELAGLQARAQATEQTVESYQERARSLMQKQVVQDGLLRAVKTQEDNYQLYLRKEEEARISDALDRRRIINVAVAEAPIVPSLPANHRILTVLLGFLLAALSSLGLAFAAERLDPTFRTPDEVASFLSIPVLAAMPREATNGKHPQNAIPTHVS